MSSTDLPPTLAAEIDAVFALLQASAVAARASGAPDLPLHPDRDLASYFVPTPADPPAWEELEADRAAAWLTEHWTRQGRSELAPLAARLVALARSLVDHERSQPGAEVSPLIYQMF